MTNRTFTIIKPNAVAQGNSGKIIDRMLTAGFKIIAMKLICMNRNQAEKFYAIHKGKPFFGEMIDFMISGPVIIAILEKQQAVPDLRKLVGNTDPQKAEPGTIRHDFAKTIGENAIHASDSDENAQIEWNWFFSENEIIIAEYKQYI